jgi:hypothetical protein
MHKYMLIFFMIGCSTENDSTVDLTIAIEDEDVRFVTLGVFTKDQETYVDTGKTLYFEVGVPCYSWTRTAQPHDDNGTLEAVDEVHDHYNSGDETLYTNESFTWTEYGPEHSQESVDSVCGDGEDGVTKTVPLNEYYEDHGGLFLRIIAVE